MPGVQLARARSIRETRVIPALYARYRLVLSSLIIPRSGGHPAAATALHTAWFRAVFVLESQATSRQQEYIRLPDKIRLKRPGEQSPNTVKLEILHPAGISILVSTRA